MMEFGIFKCLTGKLDMYRQTPHPSYTVIVRNLHAFT